jgi:hypothetical protein
MSARWQLMLGSVDPEGEKCAPEGATQTSGPTTKIGRQKEVSITIP